MYAQPCLILKCLNKYNDAETRVASETHQNLGADMLTDTLELLQVETFQSVYIKTKALAKTKVIYNSGS